MDIFIIYIYIYHFESTAVAAATPQTLICFSVYFLLTFEYIDFDTSIYMYCILLHNPFTIHLGIHPYQKTHGNRVHVHHPSRLFSNFSGVNSVRAPNFDSAKHRLNGKTCCACRWKRSSCRRTRVGWKMIWDVGSRSLVIVIYL